MKKIDAQTILETFEKTNLVFITGGGGTGKTYLINEIQDYIRGEEYTGDICHVTVTASTGIAATYIDGMTIHKFAGTYGEFSIDYYKNLKVRNSKLYDKICNRINATDLIIIDEISMVRSDLLQLLHYLCCEAEFNHDLPFGGKKILFSGDFLQLPPVVSRQEREDRSAPKNIWAFESEIWNNSHVHTFYLKEVYRQNDYKFLTILNEIRIGYCSPNSNNVLKSHVTELDEDSDITRLVSTNNKADTINDIKLHKLPGKIKSFECKTIGDNYYVKQLKSSCLAPNLLELKLGAKIMTLKNDPMGRYVNGSIGHVVEFNKDDNYPIVDFGEGIEVLVTPEEWKIKDAHGRTLATYIQVPMRLAYAITIHKSQGITLDEVYIDSDRIFAPGQAYVALSRVKSLKGLYLKNWNPWTVKSDINAIKYYRELSNV